MLKEYWILAGPSARRGLVIGVVAIVLATAALAGWVLRTDYAVLFSDVAPRDAAAMTEELDRLKVPYRLGADGSSILVDKASVPATRLKLMSKDLPLHGAVGFELFNNSDFGMTEFAQKINYQRALQGELTRTILSLQEVEAARVHVAFPEEGLFRRDDARAKASVTLSMKAGRVLRHEQIAGIQRLVAASVAGIAPQDVTIVDEHGVALTQAAAQADGAVGDGAGLKHEVEQALARKASAMLDKAFGPGRVLVSVDATLDLDQVRVTREDVTHPTPAAGDAPAGVIVRSRESSRDDAAAGAGGSTGGGAGNNTQRETEFQVGRRVEQVVSQPGSIQRLQVVAVVQGTLSADQAERLRAVLGAAVGASAERGDQVLVQSMAGLVPADDVAASTPAGGVPLGAVSPAPVPAAAAPGPAGATLAVVAGLLGVGLVTVIALLAAGRRAVTARGGDRGAAPMTADQRHATLARIREWLAEAPASSLPEFDRAAD